MKFYKYLYIGESIKNPAKVKRRLRYRAGQFSVYVITLAPDPDQLEIYHCAYLKQSYYRTHPVFIVGIASSYEESLSLILQIVQEALRETGSADLKKYLKWRIE